MIDGETMKDEEGNMVVTKLAEETLQQLAVLTGGTYVRASNQSVGLDEILKRIKAMEKHNNLLPEELMYTAPFTISNKDFEFLREEVIQLIQKLIATADKTKNERLACLNIDLFFVSRKVDCKLILILRYLNKRNWDL